VANAPLTITIDPESELGRALDEVDNEPLVLLRGGTRFRVTRESDDPWAQYDPAKVRAGLKKVAGLLTPEEGDRIIEIIYRTPTVAAPMPPAHNR
jgi:hypothetical protein